MEFLRRTAQIGATLVLHTWGSALTHHPHVHGIVPGGGLSADGKRWVTCRPGFFLPVRVLSRLFRRLFLEELAAAHRAGQLQFFAEYAALSHTRAFADWLAPLREVEWVVYAKRPFAGPAAVLAYLSRYTHRVAISNQRLLALDERGVTFRWKDYRATGKTRYKTMLTNIMFYWVTGAIGSSFWPYYARMHGSWPVPDGVRIGVPMGYAEFPKEIRKPPRSLAHEVREFFRPLR